MGWGMNFKIEFIPKKCKNYMVGDYMKILYGTTNKAKLQAMRNAVEVLDINIVDLNDIKSEIPKVNECGKTPLENAEIKAKAYYEAFKIPVFSCDSGLYFDELKDEEWIVNTSSDNFFKGMFFELFWC